MIPRYATPKMTAVWSDEARWGAALRVELAVLDAQAAAGDVPAELEAKVRRAEGNCPERAIHLEGS